MGRFHQMLQHGVKPPLILRACSGNLVPYTSLVSYFLKPLPVVLNYVFTICSSLMAIVTCLIGLQIGHVIVHFKVYTHSQSSVSKCLFILIFFLLFLWELLYIFNLTFSCYLFLLQEHGKRIVQWSIPSLSLLILGFSLDSFGNKMIC
jgi:F0F1-type ATP synthase membrane subunit c/vacuolar-type H+-ATPase subunit K